LGRSGQVVGVTQTDGELLEAAARGDGAAFGCFYRRHEQRVLGYAIGHCTNPSDVADLVAETFLQALASAGRFRSTDGNARRGCSGSPGMCWRINAGRSRAASGCCAGSMQCRR
jgi:RNA polymerase sigma-70 factor (ECF subfamily)